VTDWATAEDVTNLTGKTVDAPAVLQAQAIIELTGGLRVVMTDPAFLSPRNLEWLKRAVCYQAAYMVEHPDYFSRMDLVSLTQDGVSAVFRRDSQILSPLARRCLKRLSWRGMRTITPAVNRTYDRPAYRSSDDPDLPGMGIGSGGTIGFGASLNDDDLPWAPM
jgi:hypothetical protein